MELSCRHICGLLLLTVFAGSNTEECNREYKEFQCADGSGCVDPYVLCDGEKDCDDGSDESIQTCRDDCAGEADRFQCGDGTCIMTESVCNGSPQCSDGSDEGETRCSDCNGDPLRWKCKGSNHCIKKNQICNSRLDCGESDPSDEDPRMCEDNCGETHKHKRRFQCSNKKCIYKFKVCNGHDDCGDNSDESDQTCANCNGDTEKVKCVISNKCIRPSDRCDGSNDCNAFDINNELLIEDHTDEENCPNY